MKSSSSTTLLLIRYCMILSLVYIIKSTLTCGFTGNHRSLSRRAGQPASVFSIRAVVDVEEEERNKKREEKKIEERLQNYVRDSGMLRLIVNTLTRFVAAPAFYYEHPHCFPDFIRISEYPHWLATIVSEAMNVVTGKNSGGSGGMESSSSSCIDFKKEAYGNGDHPQQQVAQVMVTDDQKQNKTLPLVIFVHGGAWGSGFPTMYRLIASPFLKKNYRVIVLGYRTYPDATIEEQMHDVELAISYFKKKYISSSDDNDDNTTDGVPAPVVLIGHSSGAHVSLMVALKKGKCHDDVPTPLVNAFIGMSGVYDLELARQYELEQGLTELSPMGPVCNEKLKENSPTSIIGSSNGNNDARIVSTLPPILLLHGEDDTIAPAIQSKMLYKSVQDAYQNSFVKKQSTCCQLKILEGVQHQDTVLETCIGYGKTQNTLFQWLNETLNK